MQGQRQTHPFIITSTDTYFYLRAQGPQLRQPSFIKINRLTSKVTILSSQKYREQINTSQKKTQDRLYLLVGILIVNQQPYLCTVSQAQAVATINSDKIYCIKKVNFIPFKHKYLYRVINQTQNQKILQQLSQDIIKDNFYFCYQRDLTLTCQKIYQNKTTQRKYFWNQHMLKMFNYYQLPRCWRVPVIQGHVKELFCENQYFSFYYCVISRRSKFMSGTRYNSRGIDSNFNAANFVQSQQIFICHNYLLTHVAVRGSVPIFWQQKGLNDPIVFSHPDEENMLVLQNHFQFLKKEHQSNVVAINLLSKVKETEQKLANRYEYYLYKTIPNEPYIHYDFNQEIRSKENSTNQIIDKFIQQHLNIFAPNQNFFCIDRYTGKLYRQQSILPRINCLDCLDRSNVIMSRISLLFIQQVETFINSHTNMVEKKINLTRDYKDEVIEIWAELGNRISLIYSGTDSTAAHLTKQEESSFFSFIKEKINSIGRYYNSNVSDAFKQTCIDFLLGEKQQSSRTSYFDDNIVKSVLKEPAYCDYQELVMYILTWNCNMVNPNKLASRELDKLFNFPIDKTDLIVVCLQEMVELNSYNVLMGDNKSIVSEWRTVIENYLNDAGHENGKSFVHLTSYDMVGVATFVFSCGQLYNRVYKHEWHEIKTGFNNNLGNKGAIILFLQIDSSYLTIINCHLAAGETASQERKQDIQYIHNDALNERSKRRLFDRSEYKFFIGDMNFRLQAKNQNVREILYTIEKQDAQKKLTKSDMHTYLSTLLQKDEYKLNSTRGSLSMYNQATIYFLPTYKYVKKQKNYDIKRTPSWCDRILFHSQDPKKLAILKYWDVDCYQSDHKPVCGAFKVLVKKEDPDRKKKMLQEYMDLAD